MKYTYKARSKEGKVQTGTVEASSRETAALLLQKYDIIVTSIKEQSILTSHSTNLGFLNRVSKKDLAIFSRQLSVMVRSRVPITQSLKSLAATIKNPNFREKVLKVSQLVEEGNSLSEAMEAFPEVFNIFYVSLIRTGEASGKISESLLYLSDHLEREHDISSQLLHAMIYPAFVIVTLFTVIPMVIFFVMPRLISLIEETVNEPPPFTMAMINFYGFISHYGWVLIVGFILMVLSVAYYLTTKQGKVKYEEWSLKVPFFGPLLKKIFLVRFAENVSTLISAGLSINKALKITRDTVGNVIYKKIFAETEESVSQGKKISYVLAKYPKYAPPFVVQMVQVGEETGTLDKNLLQIVDFYNKEIKRSVETFTALLEPILIIFLGVAVAFLAISVIAPLYGTLGTI